MRYFNSKFVFEFTKFKINNPKTSNDEKSDDKPSSTMFFAICAGHRAKIALRTIYTSRPSNEPK
jgi:hypothetical protein